MALLSVALCSNLSIMSSSSNDRNGRTDDGNRRSKRRTISPIPPCNLYNEEANPLPKRQRTSMRQFTKEIKHCCDIEGIEHAFKCGGCSRWDESKKLKP